MTIKNRFSRYIAALSACLMLSTSGMVLAAELPDLHALQTLTRGNGGEPESLDPALAQSVGASNIMRDLFEGLTSISADGKLVPGMAASWERTDPTTWIFTLREAYWSNGDRVTAEDFVFAWRRLFDPTTASIYASTFQPMVVNAQAIQKSERAPDALGVRALSSDVLEVSTPFPIPFFDEVLAHAAFFPVHRATIESLGAQWTRPGNLVGNGAFKLSEWRVNDRIVLDKNPAYWDATNVHLTRVSYLAVEDPAAEVKLYLSGESDFTDSLPAGSYAQHEKARPDELHNSSTLGLRYYSLNNEDPLLKDRRVRQALSMVIDRDILTERILADGQAPAYGVLVDGVSGADDVPYDWAEWPMQKRVQAAQALLKEAGVAPGTRLSLAYNTSDYHKKMALFVASEWKTKLGLDTVLENMEFRVLLKRRNAGQYQIARDGWVADFTDATSMLTVVRCEAAQNSNRSCNLQAESLIDQAEHTSEEHERHTLLTRAAALIMQDYPMIPISQLTHPRLIKTYVGGFGDGNPLERYRSRDLFILKH